jgi:glycosidase
MLNLYRRLLSFRRQTPALLGGAYTSLDVGAPDCFAYLREGSDERYLIALNTSAAPLTVSIPTATEGRVVLSTHLDREEEVSLDELTLRPDEGVIVEVHR